MGTGEKSTPKARAAGGESACERHLLAGFFCGGSGRCKGKELEGRVCTAGSVAAGSTDAVSMTTLPLACVTNGAQLCVQPCLHPAARHCFQSGPRHNGQGLVAP